MVVEQAEDVLRSLPLAPGTPTAASGGLEGQARLGGQPSRQPSVRYPGRQGLGRLQRRRRQGDYRRRSIVVVIVVVMVVAAVGVGVSCCNREEQAC